MILIIDNFDSFTHNIYQQLLQVTDKEVRVIRNNKIDIKGIEELNPSHLIISPGPGRPENAGISLEVIEHFKGKLPILGVCLGHQSIISAFGGDIIQAKNIVHGKVEPITCDGHGLFRNLGTPINYTRYHSLVGDRNTLPECLEITASSQDGEIMGIRHKELEIEGVQFHPESIASEFGLNLFKNFLNYKRKPFDSKKILTKLIGGNNLTMEEATEFMEELTDGNLSDALIASILTAINCKGISAEEIAGCAKVLRAKRTAVETESQTVDTCGTGGDGLNTFNISSFSALIAAAAGAKVAKHGNRAVSSKSGSSQFYEEFGIPIISDPKEVSANIDQKGFSFLFAPHFHKAMRFAAPARKEMKVKSIMNLVGPLSNPANADFQIIGVWDEKFCPIVARAAKLLGVKRVLVVNGLDGIDELSISKESRVVFIDENNQEQDFIYNPAEDEIPMFTMEDIKGGSAAENADMARDILAGNGNEAIIHCCALNAGAALYVSDNADSIKDGYDKAYAVITDGSLKDKIAELKA